MKFCFNYEVCFPDLPTKLLGATISTYLFLDSGEALDYLSIGLWRYININRARLSIHQPNEALYVTINYVGSHMTLSSI